MTEFLTRDSQLPPYMIFPRFLLESELSETAKLLYVVLLDRALLSQRNEGWTDEEGRVYLYYSRKGLAETLHKSEATIKLALAALEKEGLLVRKQQGFGKARRTFVKCQTDGFLPLMGVKNAPSSGQKTTPHWGRNSPPNKNYRTRTIEREIIDYSCREDESL
jgi:hypothetical protein